MRAILAALAMTILAPLASAAPMPAVVWNDEADVAAIRAFFAAFDARDEAAMWRLLASSATITPAGRQPREADYNETWVM